MNEKIKITLPLDNRKIDEIQETIGYHFDDKVFLMKSLEVLRKNTIKANRLGLTDNASKLADIIRQASIHLDYIEEEERDNH